MVKFLILIYDNPASRELWSQLTEEQRREGVQGYRALNAALEASGEGIVNQALADADQTKQVTIRDGRVVTTDGPFAEVKEQLAGFYLVETETLDRAVEYAAMIPEASGFGIVEVRPVMDLSALGL
ncbi:YciI family protein [Kribbella alba]|uniref:YciI family protein n=1 Tax=Kribbella alba TaxID=190197 RepID=A0ABP4RH19_9ACTN